jgi:rubrerythrin
MGNIFAASEIVELGIQIEENGRDFYSALCHQTKNIPAAELFKFLAGEEEKHIKIFRGLLEKTEKYEPPKIYADEYVAYMKALVSEYVFTQKNKGEEIAKTIKTDKEAVELGIGFEKDSIIFYEGMKKVVPEYSLVVVEELIRQEQGHLRQLTDLKKKVS